MVVVASEERNEAACFLISLGLIVLVIGAA